MVIPGWKYLPTGGTATQVPTKNSSADGDISWAAGGGGGGGNSVTVTVDFGASFSHFAQTVVTGQAWVASGSEIVATPLAATGEDVETALFQFSASVGTLVVGTGFTLSVYSPIEAKGTYTFSCLGV